MASIVKNTQALLNKLFTEVNMPESHGLQHCLTVLDHMDKAIQCDDKSSGKLTNSKKLTLRLAALLHEADDHKYFKDGTNNAQNILKEVLSGQTEFTSVPTIESEVLEMISYVSASVNGNSVPEKAKADPTLLWPRFCDRLESIGVIGTVRCYLYNREVGAPLFIDTTPRPKSEDEVWNHVTEERWNGYQNGGDSASMMDHYYDKLLQIAVFKPEVVNNTYLVQEASKRVQPLLDVCVQYGKTGVVPEELIMSYQNKN